MSRKTSESVRNERQLKGGELESSILDNASQAASAELITSMFAKLLELQQRMENQRSIDARIRREEKYDRKDRMEKIGWEEEDRR